MIDARKLAIYRRYGGDADAWARLGTADEKAALRDADWIAIRDLLQELALVAGGRAAPRYARAIDARLRASTADAAVAAALEALAREPPPG
ncbi:hypothetical protein EV699_108127 [Plasticicumulans lactativorans]|uniref:Uncharacterized protein n=1 Tax=Plasticicumulans lactativorans TaxID=1133106 RepID=A0A4R2LB57_9GAMM|nr:hypothetical protein [Plasticicumulans lactativorans]TCO81496.1 hypothetical protein EV699_108127 [Plasticicumulans lactativorans]